jgi:hypothetical protein
MDFFVEDIPVYESFDVIQPAFVSPFYDTYEVIETVTPTYGIGFGVSVSVMPALMPCPTVCPQYGYRPGMRPVPMVPRGGYINGAAPYYGAYPPQRFY